MSHWFERNLERAARSLFASNLVLAEKVGLKAQGLGKLTDVFMTTWMGKAGLLIIAFFVCMAFYAELFVEYDKYVHFPDEQNESFSFDHLFGTDKYGRDVFTRVAVGTLPSLIVGFTAMVISMGLGTLVGLASGYWGGIRDEIMMRLNDMFLSIPWLVLMIVVASVFDARNLWAVILVIGLTGWSTTARIVRAQVLSLKERQFVIRARAIGSSDWHIINKHIFPNVVPLVFANAILTVAICILSEATLSFLRLGPQDVETWGKILEEAYAADAAMSGPLPYIVMPGLFIVFVVLGFTFVGYAMDEVLNPKLRKR